MEGKKFNVYYQMSLTFCNLSELLLITQITQQPPPPHLAKTDWNLTDTMNSLLGEMQEKNKGS